MENHSYTVHDTVIGMLFNRNITCLVDNIKSDRNNVHEK